MISNSGVGRALPFSVVIVGLSDDSLESLTNVIAEKPAFYSHGLSASKQTSIGAVDHFAMDCLVITGHFALEHWGKLNGKLLETHLDFWNDVAQRIDATGFFAYHNGREYRFCSTEHELDAQAAN